MVLYVISNFKKNRILSTKVRQLLYIFGDRLCRLTASLQKQKHKNYNKIFENIYEAADHQHKNTGVVHQFTETTVFIAKAVKKHINQFILPVSDFFCQLVDRKVMGLMSKYSLPAGDTNQKFFPLV